MACNTTASSDNVSCTNYVDLVDNIRLSEFQLLSLKRTTWKQKRDIPASEKRLQLKKIMTIPVTNHMSWHAAVCPRSCFCEQQEFKHPII